MGRIRAALRDSGMFYTADFDFVAHCPFVGRSNCRDRLVVTKGARSYAVPRCCSVEQLFSTAVNARG